MKKIVEKIPGFELLNGIITTSTFKQSSVTFIGTFLNAFFGAFFFIITARLLGPAQFGLLSIALVALNFISDVSEVGTGSGLVNFVSRSIHSDSVRANKFLKLALKIKIIIWITIFIFGILTAQFWTTVVLNKPELLNSFKIVFFGMGPLILFSYILHSLQARQMFTHWSIIQVSLNALRLLIIIIVFYFGFMTIESSLWVYIGIPFIGFLYGLKLLPKSLFTVSGENSVRSEFFAYNKWVALFSMIAALSSRLDVFISARLLTATELGYYSAAQQLVKIVPQIVVALGTVIAPKMATQGSIGNLISYLKKTQMFVIALSMLGVLSIPLVLYLIPYVFGVEYISAGQPFIILLFAMLIFLISLPVHNAVIYYFSYPKLFFYISIGHLILISTLGWYLTSLYGSSGMAFTVLIGALFNLVIPGMWVLNKIKYSKVAN